jgi:hypothetical protein
MHRFAIPSQEELPVPKFLSETLDCLGGPGSAQTIIVSHHLVLKNGLDILILS